MDRTRIAPNNIGFGKPHQPDIEYVFADHYRYIEGFIEALGLENIDSRHARLGLDLGRDSGAVVHDALPLHGSRSER